MNLRRRHRWSMLLLIAATLMCAFTAVATVLLRPPTIRNHGEAIATVLDRQGIAYERVSTDQGWPAAVNYYAYGPAIYPYSANVVILLANGESIPGKLECADDRRRCDITIARLGIDREPIPDISEHRPLPWVEWFEHIGLKVEG